MSRVEEDCMTSPCTPKNYWNLDLERIFDIFVIDDLSPLNYSGASLIPVIPTKTLISFGM